MMQDADKTKQELLEELAEYKQSEERYRSIFEDASVGIFRTTMDGKFLTANPALAHMLGYDSPQALCEQVSNIADIYVEPSYRAEILQTIQTHPEQTKFQNRYLRQDGSLLIAQLNIWIGRDEEGEIRYLEGFVEDVTELVQAEEALQESEQRFRTIADFTYDWEYWLGPTGQYLYVSPACHRITGYTPAEFQANPDLLKTITHPEDRPLIRQHLHHELEDHEALAIDFRIINRQGEERWISHLCQPVYDKYGRWLGQRASNRDITNRKETEKRLQQMAKRLQILHELDYAILSAQSPETIAQAALNHIQQLIPYRWASVVEFDGETQAAKLLAIQTTAQVDIGPEILTPFIASSNELLQQGRPLIVNDLSALPRRSPLEEALLLKGITSYVNVPLVIQGDLIGALNLEADRPETFTIDYLDIAEEIATSLAMAIRQARLYAQTRHDAETKAILLREANHRVKNNLAAIVGLLYAEQRHAGMKKQAAYQAIMSDLINRIKGLATVHDLLSVAEWSPVRLSELANQIIHSVLQARPSDKQISLTVKPSSVLVNPKQASSLALVINELATNTIKHALTEQQNLLITVQIKEEADTIRFEFRNNGSGFSDEALALMHDQKSQNVGIYLIQNIVRRELNGEVSLCNTDTGPLTVISFPLGSPK